VIIVSVVAWEVINLLVERRLAQAESEGVPVEQRQRGETLLPLLLNSTVSAPSRLAASEKLFRVLVLFSKNKFAQVFPLSNASLLRHPPVACFIQAAISSRVVISSADNDSSSSKCRRFQLVSGGNKTSSTNGLPPP